MPRENSFSDSEGRSLTPDLEEEHDFIGPTTASPVSGSPVAGTTAPHQPAFEFPPPDVRPPGLDASGLPTVMPATTSSSVVFQAQPKLAATVSAPSANPPRSATMNTMYTARTNGTSMRPGMASDKFRKSVRKIIHMNRGSSAMSTGGIGAEPGVDVRRSSAFINYGHIRQKCTIEIIDYSSVRSSVGRMENKGFVEFMEDERASKRESWVKVRWINIGGISWDVIHALAMKYDIHPLALEDVLHQRSTQSRSKADYYMKHLFIRVLRHTLAPEDDNVRLETVAPRITNLPRSSSPAGYDSDDEGGAGRISPETDDEKTLGGSKFSTRNRPYTLGGENFEKRDLEHGQVDRKGRSRTTSALRMRRKQEADAITIEELKKGERVNVEVQPFFLFLFRDGTIISINKSSSIDFTTPISARLRQRDTGLRATADPSLLVQSLLDLVVDQALEVVDEYQSKILKLEHDVLIKPNMKTVRYLHILSGDLTLHKRTLEPIKTLVYGLRRYDVDRCAALINSSGMEAAKVEGFMSHKSKIYLADVHDHIDYIISSLDMFSGISENLINYTFNMASYEMNQVMRRLTLATIIFLPLTLLTGYFGMNFEHQWSVQQNSDLLFWEIGLPVMAVVLCLFMWSDIGQAIHYLKKRWTARKVQKAAIRQRKIQ